MQRIVRAAAINIVLPKHVPSLYAELIAAASRMRRGAKIRGDSYGYLSGGHAVKDANGEIVEVVGYVRTFTQIKETAEWVSLSTMQKSDTKPDIGDRRPNFREFRYRFFVDKHLLAFETQAKSGHLSPVAMLALLERVLREDRFVAKYGSAELWIVPDDAIVDKIVRSQTLRMIDIEVAPPNPDENEDAEKRVLERMKKWHAKKVRQVLAAEPGKNLVLDAQLIDLSRAASLNGRVVATALEAGRATRLATSDKPMEERVEFDEKKRTEAAAFEQAADGIRARAERIRNRPKTRKKRRGRSNS